MGRVGFANMRRHMGRGAWTPPSGCVLWLAAANSGAVAPLGTWADASGAGNDATLVAGAYVHAANGLSLNGTTDYADLTSMTTFGASIGASTIVAWIKCTDQTRDSNAVMGTLNTGGSQVFSVEIGRVNAQNVWADIRDLDNKYLNKYSAGQGIADGSWHHIAVGFDGPGNAIFAWLNTVPLSMSGLGDAPVRFGAFEYPLVLGAKNNRGIIERHLAGGCDDVLIFPRILSEAEILDIYTNSPGSHAP